VDWNKARIYCEWAGRKLPSEAEWEKAASWDDKNRKRYVYPWGDSTDCSYANYSGDNMFGCVGDTVKVKSYPSNISPYGAYDMTGNVTEWVSSLFKPYPYDAKDGREDLGASGLRVLRGGSWFNHADGIRATARNASLPRNSDTFSGFRCARGTSP
jgi:formylglycine-generating enzyme required for sulfatase activity